jgi:aspartate oxidase
VLENVHHLGILRKLKKLGVDCRKEKFQWISPAVHTFLGGVQIDVNCETSTRGLYATGGNVGGVYGADRVETYLNACATFGHDRWEECCEKGFRYGPKEVLPDETIQKKSKKLIASEGRYIYSQCEG